MRKQLAKVGAVTVAAMMVGTTAFAANLGVEDITYVYTGLNTVTVSVPVASTSDNATILSVTNGTPLNDIGNDNANDEIVYIDQDGMPTSDANLRIADTAGNVDFTFNTERAGVAETDGKIDIFAAGSTYGVNASAVSIYKNAPAKSFAFTDATGITLAAGAGEAAIKAAFANKNVTVTHQTTGADVTSTTTGANTGMSYALNGNTVTVTFDPALATNAKYDSVSGDPLTTTVPVTVEEAPPEINGASLVATPATITFPMGTATDAITEAVLKTKLQVEVKYSVASGTAPANTPLTADDYSVALSGDASPYTATISTTKQYEGFTPASATVSVVVRDTAAVAITGTVQSRNYGGEFAPDNGAVVLAYDDETHEIAGSAVVANGAFSVDGLAADKTYTVLVAKIGLLYDGGFYSTMYSRVQLDEVEPGAISDVIKLSETMGDADGDGIANIMDVGLTNSFYNENFLAE